MITRAGRVVVMDFGLARMPTEGLARTISGTPAYMAPEQARGEGVDARADVFAAGVVLAEMLAVGGEATRRPARRLARGPRDPAARAGGPWEPVLRRRSRRTPGSLRLGAGAGARARGSDASLPGFEQKRPYPGLASFTREDAEYFFGREVEVEAVWKKLEAAALLALIGPSGAGKSSFLRAGSCRRCRARGRPSSRRPAPVPFSPSPRHWRPASAGDAQAVQALLRFEEEDAAVPLFQRFGSRHEQALVIVDQFEELFTLSPPDVQEAFARLLGRLVLEADVHVILSLRDDFLIRCQAHEALAPAFSDLTPLGPLGESALRRALVQPALACGYRFEDEVARRGDDLRGEPGARSAAAPRVCGVAPVGEARSGERAADACRRTGDRRRRRCPRAARGGDARADRQRRIPLVREMFRNLVTSQGHARRARTRTSCSRCSTTRRRAAERRAQAEEVLERARRRAAADLLRRAGDEGDSRQRSRSSTSRC